jgi:cystathionine beta-lyase
MDWIQYAGSKQFLCVTTNKTSAFDFDVSVDRQGTASMKWEKYKDRDIIPLWVADMDFRSPPAVIEALRKLADHGIFGYSVPPEELTHEVISMLQTRFGWSVAFDWIVWIPGLVTGLNVTCRAIGDDQDDVMTAVPVYPPFLTAPGYSRRNLITVPLVETDGRWRFDFDCLANAITPRTRLFILCNPHNPVGRIFTREELTTLTQICLKYDIVICSDEIHCDLLLDKDKAHIPTATLGKDIAERTITLLAPSKTFNVPGFGCSFAVIPNQRLRKNFRRAMEGIVPLINPMGYAAALAAYRYGHEWLAALLDYLRDNRELVTREINDMKGISMTHVEATYLAWINMHDTGLEDPVTFFELAGVGLSDGKDFGEPGFVRLNFGCPHSLLQKALQRMRSALERHFQKSFPA